MKVTERPKWMTRDLLLRTIDVIEGRRQQRYPPAGLCEAFDLATIEEVLDLDTPYYEIPRLLRALGGVPRGFFFWPECKWDGEREMFLAFLLTWIDSGDI